MFNFIDNYEHLRICLLQDFFYKLAQNSYGA
jgi:hypothetical protein